MKFVADAYLLAALTPRVHAKEGIQILRGRTIACEFIDALRDGACLDTDILQPALALAEICGPQVLRGFLRELTEALRERGAA